MPPISLAHSVETFLVVGLLALPRSGAAQTEDASVPVDQAEPAELIRRGDAAHTALKPLDALALYRSALDAAPDTYEALWRAAREAVDLGMLAVDGDDRKRWYGEAEQYARRARAVEPRGSRGAEWLAIALGRKALEEGPRTRVRMAVEIHDVALEALAIDSLDAGAHHVLGEWHAEIRRLSGVERWLARKLLGGGVFEEASWEAAEYHLRRSIELDPSGLIHYLDLARVYLDRNRDEEARALLREVLERPAVEPVDPLNKQAAQDLLQGERGQDSVRAAGGRDALLSD